MSEPLAAVVLARVAHRQFATVPKRLWIYFRFDRALPGGPERHRVWLVPSGLPKNDAKQIELSLQKGTPAKSALDVEDSGNSNTNKR